MPAEPVAEALVGGEPDRDRRLAQHDLALIADERGRGRDAADPRLAEGMAVGAQNGGGLGDRVAGAGAVVAAGERQAAMRERDGGRVAAEAFGVAAVRERVVELDRAGEVGERLARPAELTSALPASHSACRTSSRSCARRRRRSACAPA